MSVLPGSVNEEDRDDDLDAALETVLNVVSSLRLEHNQRQWCRNGPHSVQFICRVNWLLYFDHVGARHMKLGPYHSMRASQ